MNNINTNSKDKDKRSSTGTEYRLSTNSNSGSRRSSLAGTGNDSYLNSGEFNSYNNSISGNGRLSIGGNDQDNNNTFNILHRCLGPQIGDLHDSVITLESNLDRLNNIHNSLVDLNESFGSLLYGLICSSSCLQFPGLPNNIKKQLTVIDKLNQLETEKLNLLRQIKETKESIIAKKNSMNNNDNNMKPNQVFSKPLFTVNESKKTRSNLNKSLSNLSNSKNHMNTSNNGDDTEYDHREANYDDDDDTSSEASFVVNPSNSQRDLLRNEKFNNMDRRYRRKSILNVIRNSTGFNIPESNILNGAVHSNNNNNHNTPSSRYSLGGRARRVTHGSTLMSTPHSITSQQRNKNNINTLSRRKTVTKRPKPISERPPFR